MDPPYRAAPAPRPRFALREVTAPLGVGRGAACALLVTGALAASAPQAVELECILGGQECKLVTHSGLLDDERAVDARRVHEVTGDPHISLQRSVERLASQGGRRLVLPARGVYYDPDDMWRDDGDLAATARAFFVEHRGGYFTVRQRAVDVPSYAAFAWGLLAPLVGAAWLAWSERKTRALRLEVDPSEGTAHARSVGLGGPAIDRADALGLDARLLRHDHPSAPHLPLLRVANPGAPSLPLLTGHAPEHCVTFDRLAARANAALSGDASALRSPSRALRLAPSGLVLAASIALPLRVLAQQESLPPVTGTIVVTASTDRCAVGGVSLLPGGTIEARAPVGVTTRWFPTVAPNHRAWSVQVNFEVRPGARTVFDCRHLRDAQGALRATWQGVWPATRDDAR